MDTNRYTQAVEGLEISLSPTVVVVADGQDTWICRRAAWDATRAALEGLDEVPDEEGCPEGGIGAYARLCRSIAGPVASSQAPRGTRVGQEQLVGEAVRRGLLDRAAALRLYGLELDAAGRPQRCRAIRWEHTEDGDREVLTLCRLTQHGRTSLAVQVTTGPGEGDDFVGLYDLDGDEISLGHGATWEVVCDGDVPARRLARIARDWESGTSVVTRLVETE